MNNHGNKFMDGFVLGVIIGGAAVFLLGTKTGKNLLKIISEQGLDGLVALLQDYDLSDMEEEEDFSENSSDSGVEKNSNHESTEEPKRRFFKRVRK